MSFDSFPFATAFLPALQLSYACGYSELGTNQQLTQQVLLKVIAPTVPPKIRPPVNLMLCIDVSGSMAGAPLAKVCHSIRVLLQQMNENDHLGMVTFSNEGKLISPLRRLTKEGKSFFEGVVSTLQAFGATNMGEGLSLAFHACASASNDATSHMILFSDGIPNRGIINKHELVDVVARKKSSVTLSTLGFSEEHDDILLSALSRQGKSRYTFIENTETIPLVLMKELGRLFSCVGREICLRLTPKNGCKVVRWRNNLSVELEGHTSVLFLPNISVEDEIQLLVDVQLTTPGGQGLYTFAEMELHYLNPAENNQVEREQMSLVIEIKGNPDLTKSPEVQDFLLLVTAEETWKECNDFAERGLLDEAVRRLRAFLPKLKENRRFNNKESTLRHWYEQMQDGVELFSKKLDRQRFLNLRKQTQSELHDPTGLLRQSYSNYSKLNTIQQDMLQKLMQKVYGLPHAFLELKSQPPESDLSFESKIPIFGDTTLGRLGDITIEHPSLRKKHVQFVATPDGYLLLNLAGEGSVMVDHQSVNKPLLLKNKQELSISGFSFVFHMGIALPDSMS